MLDQIPLQLDREGLKEREDGERGGGDYLREAIISNISFKGVRLFEGGDCKGVIWPHKRENNREIGLLLVSPAYSTMKSTAERSW